MVQGLSIIILALSTR